MVLRGHIENGAVVIDEPTPLPEGAEVRIEIVAPNQGSQEPEQPLLRDRLLALAGKATGLPADAAQRHDDYLYGPQGQ